MRAFALFFVAALSWASAQETVLELDNFYPDELDVAGFTLDQEAEIYIEAASLIPHEYRRSRPLNNAWILDAETREVVWEMRYADEADRDRDLIHFTNSLQLEAGRYEVYYSSYINYNYYYRWDGPRGFIENLFSNIFHDDHDKRRLEYDELYLRVKGPANAVDKETVYGWQEEAKASAILDWTVLRDDAYFEKILHVTSTSEVEVYALGEAREDGSYDFGRIVRLDDRRNVWELSYRRSDHGGGAEKNRMSRETITLEPGYYKVFYVTDDSHSYRRWNSSPPLDPAFWGMVIYPASDNATANIALLDKEEFNEDHPEIVNFERLGDNDYRMQGFKLNKALKLHLYALGEGRDGEMFDYGWIVNADTRERVWEMDYFDTENAGGADKNRVIDKIITLQPGNYIAYYVTDGSHSYMRWNSGRPYNPQKWGLTLTVIDDEYSDDAVSEYNPENDDSILVRITRVGDHDRARATFTLEEDQWVHIYAMGEGRYNEMYDYAWIENRNTGLTVWEMTYRQTRNAGGAQKNRLYDDRLFLEAGEYEVHYRSDDSHSYAHWNDDPPFDPFNYGITISLAK